MTMKEIAYEIERLQTQAEKIDSVQNVMFEAIHNNNDVSKTYEWAFVVLGDLTFLMKNELKELTDKAFNSFRKEGDYNVN